MGFAADFQDFTRKTGIQADQIIRKVCLDLTRDIVKATPVDTGLARSNYFFGYERDRSINEGTAIKSGAPSLGASEIFAATLQMGRTFYITNNLPYILNITQYGTSKQAAPGMITALVADWQSRVDRIAGTL